MKDEYKLVLASNSPRRKELLAGLDLPFTIRVIGDIDESYPEGLAATDIPLFLSKKKAEAYLSTLADDELLITADTIVWNDNQVLGKPKSENEAFDMLRALSGHTHQVITGVSLTSKRKQVSFSVLLGHHGCHLLQPHGSGDTLLPGRVQALRQGGGLRHTGMDWLHRRGIDQRQLL